MKLAIGEIMTRGAYTLSKGQTLSTARRIMQEHSIHHLPILGDGAVIGVVSTTDLRLLEAEGRDLTTMAASDAKLSEAYVTEEDAPIVEVARRMVDHQIEVAVVVAPSGSVLGVFTASDALRLVAHEFREPDLGSAHPPSLMPDTPF